eukprot:526136-Lingulodinium_polyedra.AAC.1
MLTDISVEHYTWVAGGDQDDPDPTTASDRTDLPAALGRAVQPRSDPDDQRDLHGGSLAVLAAWQGCALRAA